MTREAEPPRERSGAEHRNELLCSPTFRDNNYDARSLYEVVLRIFDSSESWIDPPLSKGRGRGGVLTGWKQFK